MIADAGALADAVHGSRRKVAHARVPDVQVDEEVVREAVARVDAIEVERLERSLPDRRVAGLRISDVPVARRDLRQQRQHRVAEIARARDQIPRLARHEPVRLRIVDLAARHRDGQRLEVARIHLVVGRHHAGDVHPLGECALVATHDRGADTTVAFELDHLDARVARSARALGGGVSRPVVHDVDAVDERWNAGQRRLDQALLVVRGDDDRDAPVFEHG